MLKILGVGMMLKVPPWTVVPATVSATGPVVAPGGIVAVKVVAVAVVTVAAVPLNERRSLAAVVLKPWP